MNKYKNDISLPNQTRRTIHTIFDHIAMKYSNKIAIVDSGGETNYEELYSLANQMAKILKDNGVVTGSRVLIYLPQSRNYVISIIGVLKAGGVYIPVDHHYPLERVSYMLKDSGSEIIITTSDLASRFHGGKVKIIEIDSSLFETKEKVNVIQENLNQNEGACIIYTSGSTGQPKGILLSHQSILNLAETASNHFQLLPSDRFLQVASVSFSAALEELYPALLTGSTIIFQITNSSPPSISELLKSLNNQKVSVCELVTPLWHELVEYIDDNSNCLPSSLRLLITGGERLLYKKYQKWCQQNIKLIHVYGPTESAATATYYHCDPKDDSLLSLNSNSEWRMPIGKPIANTNVYILDEHLETVSTGEIGNIYISGDSLASYYVNKPSLTAEKFIPNPYSGIYGDRMYETGDLGRYLPDGDVDFIGRIDNQLKIRGYRVEPAEIEKVLESHPSIKKSVVIGLNNKQGDTVLTAYMVSSSNEFLSISEWRDYLLTQIPPYMIPSSLIYIEEIPLTLHGKIDRAVLKRMSDTEEKHLSQYVAPKNFDEGELLSIWQSVFGIKNIGCTDDFFDLGGHSLLALRIVARIRDRFKIDIHPDQILKSRTISNLADILTNSKRRRGENNLNIEEIKERRKLNQTLLESQTGGTEAFLTSISQNGIWFMDQFLSGKALYNVPWKFKVSGNLNVGVLKKALNKVVNRHPPLRSTFDLINEQVVMIVNKSMSIPLNIIDLTNLQGPDLQIELEKYMELEAGRTFDLKSGPLLRTYVIKTAEFEHIIMFNVHHIIFDGWSLDIFMKELGIYYTAILEQQNVVLPDLEYNYFDYALWQKESLQNKEMKDGIAYWDSKLRGSDHYLKLGDRKENSNQLSYTGKTIRYNLGYDLQNEIKKYSKESKTTMYIILLSAFKILLYGYTKQSDLSVGVPTAGGRIVKQFDQLIGYFVNTIILRSEIKEEMKFSEFLKQVNQTALDGYKYQEVPLDIIIQKVKPKRKKGKNPLFQVDLLLEEDPLENVSFKGLNIYEFDDVDTGFSKFDLTWMLKQRKDGLYLNVNYNSDLISKERVYLMINRFSHILEVIMKNPESYINELLLN
ncbi:hypothetical protein COF04_29580 [Bacillus toyonensis]|uniref:Carrier domain-containing protein n=3 Tax=Bacillus toyonensis TaxID=155322 RepID=A0AAP8F067_9BACI|nr:non-ribosomal peptide synthetase [Bacillus toyonensis]PEB89658.1 hypothetical protein CON81_29640 [Bacillus toyonensis]PEF79772.1 hypothetical protein CON80_18655 [Bacillus toyonensis]PFY18227.1 hypothetical protein COL44_28065 [Bacillus toyonensis]PHB93279.1 hypothetical protein COF04_29580 [Bacillus toyonensis]PHE05827.1 hypothetical protein COF62_29345 [Bacillus toyonensis]